MYDGDVMHLLVVLDLSLLQSLVHASLDLLAQCVHLVRLLLNESGLCGDYLLVSALDVSVALLVLHLLSLDLHLMGLSVLLLLGQLLLDLLQVEQLSRLLESQGQPLLENLSVLLQVAHVALLKSADRLLVLLLNLRQRVVPALVEVLVLHEMGLLYLLALTCLIVDELLASAVEVLDLELLDAVLGHLSLHVLTLCLALLSVLFKDGTVLNET